VVMKRLMGEQVRKTKSVEIEYLPACLKVRMKLRKKGKDG